MSPCLQKNPQSNFLWQRVSYLGAGSPHSDIGPALGRRFPGLLLQEKGKNDRAPENKQISRVSPQFSELFLPSHHLKSNYTICLHGDEKKLDCRDLKSDHSPH